MSEEKNVVSINGEEYSRDDMSDQQNYIVEQCRDLQTKRQQATIEALTTRITALEG